MSAAAQLRPDLWRWLARHPEWEEGQDWGPEVASYAWAGDPQALVLFDPLLTDRAHWAWLDSLIEGHGGELVAVAITCGWHGRSGGEVLRRYGNSLAMQVWAHAAAAERLAYPVAHGLGDAEAELPAGVRAYPIDPVQGEVAYWVARAATLVAGDTLLGAEPARSAPLSVCPQSWLEGGVSVQDVAAKLGELLDLPVAAVAPTHGAAVTHAARAQLEHAVNAAR